jgi:hypothetical protein
MLQLSTEKAAARLANEERIPLFAIDGVEYTIPKHIDAGLLLRFLDDSASGETAAIKSLLKELIGDEGYKALINFKGLAPEELAQLMEDINTYAMGQVEGLTEKVGAKLGN